jgi:predicted O-methyltransferase YrrM
LAALLAAWSLSLGLAFHRSRRLLDIIVRHFGWESALGEAITPHLPRVAIEDLFPRLSGQVVFPTPMDGNISPLELAVLVEFVRQRGAERVFEIGTFDGRTAANLALNSPPGARVFTLDLPPGRRRKTALPVERGDVRYMEAVPGERLHLAGPALREKTISLYGDSATFDYAPYEGSMDLVFVDGSHHPAYVRNDTRVALRLLRTTGGIVIWHDYANPYWPGVTRVLDKLRAEPALAGTRHIAGTSLAYCDVPSPRSSG